LRTNTPTEFFLVALPTAGSWSWFHVEVPLNFCLPGWKARLKPEPEPTDILMSQCSEDLRIIICDQV
uniref:Uncharacterized protein n=1 Tax=Seriola lalandi dorsalis TaxID=1841481 RepID=A0A3B4WJ51_SERLL